MGLRHHGLHGSLSRLPLPSDGEGSSHTAMTILKSFWVLVYHKVGETVILGASAYMESSMLNALTRHLTKPIRFYILMQHSDVFWECEDQIEINGHRTKIVVLFQDHVPVQIAAWSSSFCIVDHRDPELRESAKRESGGFRRMPGSIQF